MKADVLAVIDIYATGMQWATWIWIASALFLTGLAAWVLIRLACRTFDAFAHANQVIADLDLDTRDAELAAGLQRLGDAINQTRKEEQP